MSVRRESRHAGSLAISDGRKPEHLDETERFLSINPFIVNLLTEFCDYSSLTSVARSIVATTPFRALPRRPLPRLIGASH